MTSDLSLLIIVGIGIAACICLLGVKIGHILGKAGAPITLTSDPTPAAPQVVVNVPADYRPLEPLTVDGKPALVGPRALLWYSVFTKAMEIDGDTTYSKWAANEAVRQVYGGTFDT